MIVKESINFEGGMDPRQSMDIGIFAKINKSMKLVKENVNFERGQDPKDSMEIGNVDRRALVKNVDKKYV
jgi:hypothetical protein